VKIIPILVCQKDENICFRLLGMAIDKDFVLFPHGGLFPTVRGQIPDEFIRSDGFDVFHR